ncbi:MAG: hypothetical protein NVV74_24590 [Magnetospirillum sp.]|nr:hypothetical protein [Magnetospirillum sp.]
MSKHMPPVPPEQRTPHGGSANPQDLDRQHEGPEKDGLAHQGEQGNIRQNTTHQGYQQDR